MRSNASALLFTTTLSVLLCQINSESFFGIGHRVYGDRLLVKDEIENRHTGFTDIPIIQFSYKITEPLSCIEITSEKNILAEVHFGYYDSLINGTMTPLSTAITTTNKNEPFEIRILIYGFNETISMVDPEDILRQQMYDGVLQPTKTFDQTDHMEMMNFADTFEFSDDITAIDEVENTDANADDSYETFGMDHIIEIGERQPGDYIIYETEEISPEPTAKPTKHEVTFDYTDPTNTKYITCIKILIFDYFKNKDVEAEQQNFLSIGYQHYTPNELKITLTDHKTTSLFAKISIYGYNEKDLPFSYKYYGLKKAPDQEKKIGIVTEMLETFLKDSINATSSQRADGLPRYEKINLNVNRTSTAARPSNTRNIISIIYSLGLVAIVCKL